ncbi:MAG: phenylalanine--tRNA ligase subunit beta [Thermoleophilia bacterium]|nr:phenylalanine--tRNA ligase subunit beta [Thermoleophilia bacterium]
MKVPVSWLKEYISFDISAHELADRLALTGTEVERVGRAGLPATDGNLDRFVIGQVRSKAMHPDAAKLSLCDVDIGGGKTEKIVCGAQNFEDGDKAAVCLPGGVLPDGRTLEAAVIRGVESHGMMCSEAELGLSSEAAGIMILPEDAPIGGRLIDYLPVSDEVLELEVTPNRPDCLSVYGVAREVSAVLDAPLMPEPVEDIEPRGDDDVEELIYIEVADPDLCPRYAARIIAGVNVGPSPAWLKARLVAAGIRPVNNVVDITNYVMWSLGEPMHAFDLAKIAGNRILVRRAMAGEKITTIDGTERALGKHMLVIADNQHPIAIAGIMGSEDSEVSGETTDIMLEAANFSGPGIMASSLELGLRSESSTRFEKGIDPELVPKALAMAARMLVELAGGRLVPGQYDIYTGPPSPVAIHLREERIESILGLPIAGEEAEAILARLGFGVRREDSAMHVDVPTFRADVTREIDLIEEVARVFGVDAIPSTLPSGMRAKGGLSEHQAAERGIARRLADSGLSEVISYTFIAPDFADRLMLKDEDPRRRTVPLANPLSVEQSVMRTLMLPSILQTVALNLAQRNQDINIFELGRVYLPVSSEKLPLEKRTVAGCVCGSMRGESWTGGGRVADFFTGKGLVENAFAAVNGDFQVRRAGEPFLHPGKSAGIMVAGEPAGYVGEVHPRVLEAFGIDRPVTAFEIDEDALIGSSAGIVQFEDLITFPAAYQDIAVTVGLDTTAEEIISVVREAGAPLLRSARVFDVYKGEQVGEGKKSVALGLEFRSPERTLTDEDVDAARQKIILLLAERLNATLRA